MRRFGAVLLVAFVLALPAAGHFIFVVPDADGAGVKVVFSDSLAPDEGVDIAKASATKLSVRDASGKETPVPWKKGDHALLAAVPGTGTRTVFGSTEYGVSQRGDAKPARLTYYPKAILGDPSAAPKAGDAVPLEIVPVVAGGKVRFQVLAKGKPAEGLEVNVMVPGEEGSKKSTSDKEGMTPEYGTAGRYGVYARQVEAVKGDVGGKKYEEARYYATLVVDIGTAKATR